MDKYKTTFETWEKVASLYEEYFMDLDLYNDTYDTFCEAMMKPNPKILEIGCGPGNITRYMLTKRADFDIQGIDIASNMIKLAKKNNPKAIFKVMDIRNIGELETKYDGIICGFCLPYLSISDCSKLMKDSENLLSENGVLYLSFVEGDYKKSGYQAGSSGDKIYFYFHNLENIKVDLIQKGFEIINISYKHYSKKDDTIEVHTVVIAKKVKWSITV